MVHPVCHGPAGAEGVLQAAVKAFHHPIRLRVVGGRLAVLDLEPLPTLPISPSPISPSLILPSSKPFALVSFISLILIMNIKVVWSANR
jgi:hypothetical protein